MSQAMETAGINATWPAHRAIARLRAALGERVVFVQSGHDGAGDVLTCLPDGDFLIGEHDVRLGVIDGCPYYIDARLDQAWGRVQLTIDVRGGDPQGPSLAAGSGEHFVTSSARTTALHR